MINFGWAEKADLTLAQTSREALKNKKKDIYISVDISAEDSYGLYSGIKLSSIDSIVKIK